MAVIFSSVVMFGDGDGALLEEDADGTFSAGF